MTFIGRKSTDQQLINRFLANVNSCSCSLYVVVRPSVCRLSVCLSSVTFVHPTQPIEIFGNVSTPFGTLAVCDPSVKILRRSFHGNPSVGRLNQSCRKMTLNDVMAVILRYFTEFGKHMRSKHITASICGGIYARVYCIL